MIRKATLLAALTLALLAPTAAAMPGTAAVETAGATAATRQSIALTISAISDVPKSQTALIKISGTVRNDTGAAMDGLRVRLRYTAQKFTDRATMTAYQTDQNPATLPGNVSKVSSADIPQLQPGGSFRFEVTATPIQLGLASFGVYPVAVEVTQWDTPITAQRTYLTYAPPTLPKPPRNRLAIVLPVIDQPHRSADNQFADDKLGASLAGNGRLADLAAIAKAVPKTVTWFVSSALLDDAQALTKAYSLKVKDQDKPQTRPADANAGQWLESMRTALAGSPVVATPYGDPDVAALAHQGLDTETAQAINLGREVATQVLKRDVSLTTNWPAGGALDPDALDLLAVSKVNRVLLNSRNLPTQQPVTYTPDAASTLDSVQGPVTALVADEQLSRMFEPDSSAPSSILLDKQRFIAQTAMIAAEPGQTTPRSIVIAPSQRWNPNPALVTSLIKTAGSLPWLTLTPLSSLKPGAMPVPRAPLNYTDRDRKEELNAKYLAPIKDLAAKSRLTSLIEATPAPRSQFDASVLRLTSAAWRTNMRFGRGLTSQVSSAVQTRIKQISITGADPDRPRTLAGRNGRVPISVKNSLDEPITLYIDVKSNNPNLLQIDYQQYRQEPLTILKGQSDGIQVPMTATSDGDATVTVQLRTANRLPYGAPVKLTIRTTGYTGIALVIIGAALAVMLAAAVTRVLRRRSQRRLARAAKNRESETV